MVTKELVERIDGSQIRTAAESLLSRASEPPSGDPTPDPDLTFFTKLIPEQLRVIQVAYGARAPFNAGYWTGVEDTYQWALKRMATDEQGSPTDRLTDRHTNSMAIHWHGVNPSLSLQIDQEELPSLPLLRSVTISSPQKTRVFNLPVV